MQPINNLLQKIQADYPDIVLIEADDFMWSAQSRTIRYCPSERQADQLLLHELAHAIHNHQDFLFDIELIAQEREAWDTARLSLANRYNTKLSEKLIEEMLDTYREWLYARSLCPSCGLTGLQTKTSTYVCANCRCSWRPNDARRCALRRYINR